MAHNEFLQPRFCRVNGIKFENNNTFTLTLAPPSKEGFSFLPGQFNMLYAFGIGEVPISLSGTPEDRLNIRHTIKIVGKATEALSRLAIGEMAGMRGPFGSAWPLERCLGRDLIIIAGGIGLAPLKPMIHTILSRRGEFGKVALLYGAREPKEMIFTEELKLWADELQGDLLTTVDFAFNEWHGHVGVVPSLISMVPWKIDNAIALLCGPEIMLRFTARELLAQGCAQENIYLSMERNMKCAIGHCGRCQFVSQFICKDGPVLPYKRIEPFFGRKEL